jgi:CHAT domain-containing protein
MKESKEREIIKKYLLGDLRNEDSRQDIERRLMIDDTFEEEISICEDELIDDYLNERLSQPERIKFENHFSAFPQIREKMQFAYTFKTYLAEQNQVVKPKIEKNTFLNRSSRFFSNPAFTALAVVLICTLAFGTWYVFFRQSDLNKGLIAFQQIYGKTRPWESRVSGLEYAPLNQTRGADDTNDRVSRAHAESLLFNAAMEKNAAALHALGKLYLAEKNLDKAIAFFEQAEKIAPDSAELQSDFGAALLEMSRKASSDQDGAKILELWDKSLRHLEKAIELNPQMLEPRFNRALGLQLFSPEEQAKQAWREYLKLDADSKWAEEARQRLETLESQKNGERSAKELESDFLDAFAKKNEEEAWRLLIRNRELIKEKYLPQRLAMSFLEASQSEKKELLQALEYAAQIEKKRIGDPFAGEIAKFYTTVSENKHDLLKKAQSAIRNGYKLCLDSKYSLALDEFNKAHDLFSLAGNTEEAKIAEYFIAYCLQNNSKIENGLTIFNELVEFCEGRKYKWLELTVRHWVANSYITLRRYTQAKINYEKALSLAEEINDSYAIQRNLCGLAVLKSSIGQKNPALNYVHRILQESAVPGNSLRQKYRNYQDAIRVFTSAKLLNLAKTFALEAVSVADETRDPILIVISRNYIGNTNVEAGNYAEGEKWLMEALQKANALNDDSSKKRTVALALLRLAALERRIGNYEKALQYSEDAIKLYQTIDLSLHLFETHKEILAAYVALKKDAELEKQIPATLKIFEENRGNITEAQERTSFFDAEQKIYDIAVDYEYRAGRVENAFNYAENSSSRSLLDWLQRGAGIPGDTENTEISLTGNAKISTHAEIRQQMPDQVQMLRYSVLENKVLIWVVSKEKSVVAATEIDANKLNEKVQAYLKAVSVRDEAKQLDAKHLSRELYDLLIAPIRNELDPGREICIVPDKILFHLSFGAFFSPDDLPFLTEFNLFYAPSANVFLFCTKNAAEKAETLNETLLSVGNPSFDRRMFDDFPDLPDAETEAREIADFYDEPRTLFGRKATKTAFQNSLKNAEIIHFAGHYAVVPNAPLYSSLLLAKSGSESSDGVLTNAELLREKLPRAKLIVLSACQTGIENYYKGEGLVGLSRTFLAAGAPLVVASRWKVDSKATAELMKNFHFYRRREKLSTTAALRRAQIEMLNQPDGQYRQPYYWAAFAAFGGYARF